MRNSHTKTENSSNFSGIFFLRIQKRNVEIIPDIIASSNMLGLRSAYRLTSFLTLKRSIIKSYSKVETAVFTLKSGFDFVTLRTIHFSISLLQKIRLHRKLPSWNQLLHHVCFTKQIFTADLVHEKYFFKKIKY